MKNHTQERKLFSEKLDNKIKKFIDEIIDDCRKFAGDNSDLFEELMYEAQDVFFTFNGVSPDGDD